MEKEGKEEEKIWIINFKKEQKVLSARRKKEEFLQKYWPNHENSSNHECDNLPGVSSAKISTVVPLDSKGSGEGTPSKRKFNLNLEDTESPMKKRKYKIQNQNDARTDPIIHTSAVIRNLTKTTSGLSLSVKPKAD